MLRRHVAFLVATISVMTIACTQSSPGQAAGGGSSAAPSAAPSAGQFPDRSASPGSATASPSAAPAATALRVVALDLRADPAESVGACPLEITFTSTITVVGGSGSVSYRWRSSDGDVSPVKSVSFTKPGSMIVSSTWTVDAAALPTHAGWSSIELVDPAPGSSTPSAAPAAFAFTCPKDDDIEAIGFGIGGSDADCSIAKNLRTFTSTDHIRMVANYWPSLRAGTVVTFSLRRDGVLVEGYPVTVTYDASTKCVHGNVSNGHLAAGHYRLDVEPDTARAVGGEFDVR